ncbi:hypothetical protein I6F35_33640 [Bradyrhizobium sp. BRP22]|uniref:hypothetical protein n=1 Tax=Bradyrhizobium sp. BRP22 TaxID=2793821 RepID=UPI001CD28332|nr:hypothetical protein [Bradyrhizobium sp. BRP22]MCA1458079.1 hypothetical protein [Bradyrhizobium sp. BRP22]
MPAHNAVQGSQQPIPVETLPTLIEQIGNELAILEKTVDEARHLADRLYGAPPRDANVDLKTVQSDPEALLHRLRSRLSWLESLNHGISREVSRIGTAL